MSDVTTYRIRPGSYGVWQTGRADFVQLWHIFRLAPRRWCIRPFNPPTIARDVRHFAWWPDPPGIVSDRTDPHDDYFTALWRALMALRRSAHTRYRICSAREYWAGHHERRFTS